MLSQEPARRPSWGPHSPPPLTGRRSSSPAPSSPRCLICFLSTRALQGRAARGSGWVFRPVPSLQPRHIRQGQTWCWGGPGAASHSHTPPHSGWGKEARGRQRCTHSPPSPRPKALQCQLPPPPCFAFEHHCSRRSTARGAAARDATHLQEAEQLDLVVFLFLGGEGDVGLPGDPPTPLLPTRPTAKAPSASTTCCPTQANRARGR